VLERLHRNLREAGTLMTHARGGRGRQSVRDEEGVFDIVHDNPSNSTRHISSATARYLRKQHGVLRVSVSCICFIWSQCKGCSRGQTSPSTFVSMGATKDCEYSSMPVPWRGMTEDIYATEVRVCHDLINRIQLTATGIVGLPGLLFVRGPI
jgi:hypothetical protein